MALIRLLALSLVLIVVLRPSIGATQSGLSVDAVARINELFLRSADIAHYYSEVHSAASSFADALQYVRQAESGQTPTGPVSRWDGLVASYDTAAKKIKEEKLATAFNEDEFAVSWKDFWGCHTRDGAVETLQQFSAALGAALERGADANSRYESLLADASAIDVAVDELIKILERAPVIAPFFRPELDALALRNSVQPSIGHLLTVVKTKQRETESVISRVRVRKNNLDSNLAQLRSVECNLAGSWTGTLAIEGNKIEMQMHIRGEPGKYSLTYSLRGRANNNPCVIAISSNERRIEFKPSCKPPADSLRFSLNLDPSFTSLNGVETDESDPDARFPISMRRH